MRFLSLLAVLVLFGCVPPPTEPSDTDTEPVVEETTPPVAEVIPVEPEEEAMEKDDAMEEAEEDDAMEDDEMMEEEDDDMMEGEDEDEDEDMMEEDDEMMDEDEDDGTMEDEDDEMMEDEDEEEDAMMKEEEETTPAAGGGAYIDSYDDVSIASAAVGNGETSLLFFYAAWCSFCKTNDGRLQGIYQSGEGAINAYRIDYDTAEDLKAQFGIAQQDTFVLIGPDGAKIEQVSFPSEEKLRTLVSGS